MITLEKLDFSLAESIGYLDRFHRKIQTLQK